MKKLTWLIPIFFGVIYILCAPTTVQHGDTGEMVMNSYLYRVVHPSGYPLFINIYHAFTNLIAVGTVFFRASLLTILLSISTLVLIYKSGTKKAPVLSLLITTITGFSCIYWQYSLLPDVFMLNCFFIALISYIYLNVPESPKKTFWMIFLFALGLCNHPTLIFLAPLAIHDLLKGRHFKAATLSFILGTVTFTGIYSTIMAMHPESFTSWKEVANINQLINHVLRKDYGSLNLARSVDDSVFAHGINFYLMQFNNNFWAFVLILITALLLFLKNKKTEAKIIVYSGTVITYIVVFLFMAKMNPILYQGVILERFLLLPNLMIAFVAARSLLIISNSNKKIVISIATILSLNAILNVYSNFNKNNYRKNTIVEDYAINLFQPIADDPSSVLIIQGDTFYYSTSYVQEVLGVKKNVLLYVPSMSCYSYMKKISVKNPKINIPPMPDFTNADTASKRYEAYAHEFLKANSEFNIYTNGSDQLLDEYPKEYFGITAKFLPKDQQAIFHQDQIEKYTFRSDLTIFNDFENYDVTQVIYSKYAFADKIQALYLMNKLKFKESLVFLNQALETVPYSITTQKLKCAALIELRDKNNIKNCLKKVDDMTGITFPTY